LPSFDVLDEIDVFIEGAAVVPGLLDIGGITG
jgi:hypothetical protein